MTTKVLNKSWFDTLQDQYQQDLEAEIVFPLTYILYYKRWDRDLHYEIKHKISVQEFHTSLVAFHRSHTTLEDDPSYQDQSIKIYHQAKPEPEVFLIHDRLPGSSSDSENDISSQSKETPQKRK
ncbi:hypothetical protein F4819DRAFT_462601 [Hypoxylon fuscum]|nr:hypothetical protein F4819DRAFT_462601 [Hypoxylon fuscum]